MVGGIDEIAVDLIIHDDYVVFQADIPHPGQLFFGPYPSCRVVGTAQQEYFYVVIFDFLLKISKVYGIFSIFIMELAIDEFPAIVFDHFPEGVVHRLLDQHRIPRFRERLHPSGQAIDHAAAQGHPFRLDMVAVMDGEPPVQRCVIFGIRIRITEDPVVDPFVEVSQDLFRQGEIHIRHPHRQKIRASLPLHAEVIFQAAGVLPVDDPVKIVMSHDFISSLYFSLVFKPF